MRLFRALLAAALLAPAASAAPLTVRVYHTNDVHGWIMPRADKDGKRVGGMAALSALMAKDPAPRLLLDGGDWWQGTPEGSLTKGQAVAELFNALGYDALAIGNHDYDAGQDALREMIKALEGAALSANTYGSDGKRVPWAKPWTIVERAGIKFGIFGLTTTGMRMLAFPKYIAGLEFRPVVEESRKAVAELKAAGADVIIAVTHVGYEQPDKPRFDGDQTIAREVPGIDLIVGGHTHWPLDEEHRDPKNGTLVVQAGSYLTKVGRTTLEIDPKTKKVLSARDDLLDLDVAETGEDARIAAIVARWGSEVGKVYDVVIATASARLDRHNDRESGMGSWMADCVRAWAGTEVGLMNGGGVRAELLPGPVTYRMIFEAMPFDNRVVVARMKGSALRSVYRRGLGSRRIIQVSGMKGEYRRPAPPERRIVSVEAAGGPLDDARVYTVAANDFMAQGGEDADDEFAGHEIKDELLRDVLAQCARGQKLVAPPEPGRLKKRED